MGGSGSWGSVLKHVFDPGTTGINLAHKYTPFADKDPLRKYASWLVDFAETPRNHLANFVDGKDAFAQHKNWGGGESSALTDTMRGMTEGQYFKEWDKYSTTSQREAAVTAEKYKAKTPPPEREKLTRTTRVTPSQKSLLSDEDQDYLDSVMNSR